MDDQNTAFLYNYKVFTCVSIQIRFNGNIVDVSHGGGEQRHGSVNPSIVEEIEGVILHVSRSGVSENETVQTSPRTAIVTRFHFGLDLLLTL